MATHSSHPTGAILIALFLCSCGGGNASRDKMDSLHKDDSMLKAAAPGLLKQQQTDSLGHMNAPAPTTSAAARDNPADTLHQFIRTADLRFRVKNVRSTTYQVEDIALHFGGFVTQSHLASTQGYTTLTPVSADSSVETMHYTVENTIVMRVPVEKLDSTLKAIAPLIDYLDYRNVDARDIRLERIRNLLRQRRSANYQHRVDQATAGRPLKVDDATTVATAMMNQQESADEAWLENQQLADQLRFATLHIQLYQSTSILRHMRENDRVPDAWKPGYGSELHDAAKGGWDMLKGIVWVLVRIWPFTLLMVIGGWVTYRLLRKK